jgi:hypothetical protein
VEDLVQLGLIDRPNSSVPTGQETSHDDVG